MLHTARGLRQSVVQYVASLFIIFFFVKDIGFVRFCRKTCTQDATFLSSLWAQLRETVLFLRYFPFKFCWIPTGPMLFTSTSRAYFQSGLYINFIAFFNPLIIITVISTMYEMNRIKFHKCQIQPILRKRNIVLNKAFSSFLSKGDHYCEMNGCTCSVEYIYFPESSFVFSLCFSGFDVRFIADQYRCSEVNKISYV